MICGVRVRQQLISSRQCKRAAPCRSRIGISTSVPPLAPASSSWSSSSNSSTVAAEPVADKGADKVTAPTEGAGLSAAGRAATPSRWEWRPSEAHKASATSVARKQAQSARLKAGVAPRVAAPGASTSAIEKARSPGLRRRELLGGAEDVPSQAQIAAASATPTITSTIDGLPGTPIKAAAATAASAGKASARSVVSLSATTRFRAKRELERLAAAGDAEAIEALRASESSSTSFSSSQTEPGGGTRQSGGGGGLTPLTVLPVLLALVGAGYCVVNDLVPEEWLSWIGAGAGSSGDSASARTESCDVGDEEGGGSSLSPLLRTLSRVAAFVPLASSTATTSVPASSGQDASGDVVTEVANASSAAIAAAEEETAEAEEAGQEGGGGWGLRSWWSNGSSGGGVSIPARDVEGGREDVFVVGGSKGSRLSSASAEFAGEARGSKIDKLRQDEASDQLQQGHHPRWLIRWRAPPPDPSGSS